MSTLSAPRRLVAAAALAVGGLALTPLVASAATVSPPAPGGYTTPTTTPPPTIPGGFKTPTAPLPDLTIDTWDASESDGSVDGQVHLSAPLDEDLFVTVNPLFITTNEWDFGCPEPGDGFCGWYIDLEIPAGQTGATFEMSIVDDDGAEPAEIFGFDAVVWDDGIVDVGPPAQAYLFDGEGIQLSLADEAESWEGDVGSNQTLDFVVTASQAPPEDLWVGFHTAVVGFGATPDVDHEAVNEYFVLPAGQTEVTIEVPVIGDVLDEDDELLFGHIEDPSMGDIGLSDGTAVGRILDDDGEGEGPPPAKGFQVGTGFTTRR
jgi:hypothetical protein